MGRAIDFFFTEQGNESRTIFTSAGTPRTTPYLRASTVASITLEGLLRLASRNATPDEGEPHARRCGGGQGLADGQPGECAQRCDSSDGWMGWPQHARPPGAPIDVLYDWHRRSLLAVTEDDIQAWDRTRNPGSHGGLIGPAPGASRTGCKRAWIAFAWYRT